MHRLGDPTGVAVSQLSYTSGSLPLERRKRRAFARQSGLSRYAVRHSLETPFGLSAALSLVERNNTQQSNWCNAGPVVYLGFYPRAPPLGVFNGRVNQKTAPKCDWSGVLTFTPDDLTTSKIEASV